MHIYAYPQSSNTTYFNRTLVSQRMVDNRFNKEYQPIISLVFDVDIHVAACVLMKIHVFRISNYIYMLVIDTEILSRQLYTMNLLS